MAGAAAPGTTETLRREGDGSFVAEAAAQRAGWYERELRRRWVQAKGREPQRRQLELMVACARWLDTTAPTEGEAILRSVPQLLSSSIGRAMGWTSTGNARLDHQRFSNRFKRGFDYLAAIGWVAERRFVLRPSGAGVGILVVPGPCSSTGAATALPRRLSRSRRASCGPARMRPRPAQRGLVEARPARFQDHGCLPPSGSSASPLRGELSEGRAAPAGTRARGGGDSAEPELTPADRRERAVAALNGWWTAQGGAGASGAELLDGVPALRQLGEVDVVRLVAELALPSASPVISSRQRRRLVASIRRADRFADMGAGREGAGLELALNVVLGDWESLWVKGRGRRRPPRSLGAIAVCVHRESRRWRRHDQARRAG